MGGTYFGSWFEDLQFIPVGKMEQWEGSQVRT